MTEGARKSATDLLSLLSHGDIDSYHELFSLFSEKLYNYVYNLTQSREAVEDNIQDTFNKTYKALQGIYVPHTLPARELESSCYDMIIGSMKPTDI